MRPASTIARSVASSGFLLTLALAAACSPPAEAPVVLDLVAAFDRAAVDLEQPVLKIGRPEATAALGRGWAADPFHQGGLTCLWGGGEASELRFYMARPRSFEVELTGFAPLAPGRPPQRVRPSVNGAPLAALALQAGAASYRVHIPAEPLVIGDNRLTLGYSWSASVGGEERAAAWCRFLFRREPRFRNGPEADPIGGALTLPFGSEVRWELPPQATRLALDGFEVPAGRAGRIVVEIAGDGERIVAGELARAAAERIVVELPPAEPGAELVLRGEPAETAPARAAPAILHRPRLESAPAGHRGPTPSPPSGGLRPPAL